MPLNSRLGRIVVLCIFGVALIVMALSVVTLIATSDASNAVRTLKQTSQRSECRTRVVNEFEDAFRRSIAEVLEAASTNDNARVTFVVKAMKDRPTVNHEIARRCPPAISTPETEHPNP